MLGLRPLSVLIHELKQLNVFKGVGFWVHIGISINHILKLDVSHKLAIDFVTKTL